ncbi:unnamed protein product [Rodentolepis nana]|uniref:Secreted protein n=1 Tax=Rodentolepis nana TaxID=102285 RepID=A0A0R3TQH8_RODNA|nr:unnamed protein product [Rodentolepis nana]
MIPNRILYRTVDAVAAVTAAHVTVPTPARITQTVLVMIPALVNTISTPAPVVVVAVARLRHLTPLVPTQATVRLKAEGT